MNNIKLDNIEIKVMTLDDLKTIKEILISDFDEFWNYNVFKAELQSENSKYLVAKLNNEINSSAIHLYENFNFKITGNRKNYYNSSNAILMTKGLN